MDNEHRQGVLHLSTSNEGIAEAKPRKSTTKDDIIVVTVTVATFITLTGVCLEIMEGVLAALAQQVWQGAGFILLVMVIVGTALVNRGLTRCLKTRSRFSVATKLREDSPDAGNV
jgi:hypothetical protein